MNKELILKSITKDEYIEARDFKALADKFAFNYQEVYDTFKEYNENRYEYWFNELVSGDEYTIDGESVDIGDYVVKRYDEGESLVTIGRDITFPYTSLAKYMEYLGYDINSSAEGEVKDKMDELATIRKQSREMYYRSAELARYQDLTKQEKELKVELQLLLVDNESKQIKHEDITCKRVKQYNASSFSAAKLVKLLGKKQAKELLGIEEIGMTYTINTWGLDKKMKGQ